MKYSAAVPPPQQSLQFCRRVSEGKKVEERMNEGTPPPRAVGRSAVAEDKGK